MSKFRVSQYISNAVEILVLDQTRHDLSKQNYVGLHAVSLIFVVIFYVHRTSAVTAMAMGPGLSWCMYVTRAVSSWRRHGMENLSTLMAPWEDYTSGFPSQRSEGISCREINIDLPGCSGFRKKRFTVIINYGCWRCWWIFYNTK